MPSTDLLSRYSYVGGWSHGEYHGYGEYADPAHNEEYQGNWQHGLRDGCLLTDGESEAFTD